ncbi:MAG: hypothetical protein HUU01_01765 [Saprospiraceae bacterium]|nr:hypothetical protein [Saprospiraceae bacterium]
MLIKLAIVCHTMLLILLLTFALASAPPALKLNRSYRSSSTFHPLHFKYDAARCSLWLHTDKSCGFSPPGAIQHEKSTQSPPNPQKMLYYFGYSVLEGRENGSLVPGIKTNWKIFHSL